MFKRLLKIRGRRAIALWIVLLLALPLILFFHWGMGGGNGPGPGGTAGVVFGRAIPWDSYQQEYQVIRRGLESQLGSVPEAFEPFLQQQTWDRIILREEARRRMRATDQEVARYLRAQPTFQQDGQFVPGLYYRFVRGIGSTPRAFEERIRDDLRIQALVESVEAEATVTDEELRIAYAKTHDRLRAALIRFTAAEMEPQVKPTLTDDVLREAYEAHQDRLRRPAKRLIRYLGVPASALPGELEDVRKRLLDAALDLEEDVERGLSFEEIAAARALPIRSTGPVDRQAAADMPDGPTALMLRAAFDVPAGQMTQVFETPVGVFLLHAAEETPAFVPPFEEIRREVEQLTLEERSREAAQARAASVRQELQAARKRGVGFDEACASTGVAPLRPPAFTAEGPIETWGDVPAVTQALAELAPGTVSEVLDTPEGFALGIVEERLPFEEEQFTADRDRFRDTLLDDRRKTRTAQWLEALRTRARLKDYLTTRD
ncbi:MAG: SurA N-terminal domain-containing protein [Candidatus Omnitrophica bacterium]|nr:SurA N-terminal domain-containing protein [Candidatus Omnitrophota bacterium]